MANVAMHQQDGSGAVLPPLIDQDCLLPSAWRLVGAVNAACPTAGPFLPLQQLVTGSLNTTSARCWLFRVIDPANELISTERGEAFPKRKDFPIRSQCCLKILTCVVDSALGKSVHPRPPKQCCLAEFVSSALNVTPELGRWIMECPRLGQQADSPPGR